MLVHQRGSKFIFKTLWCFRPYGAMHFLRRQTWHQSGTRCQSVSGEASCTSSGRNRGLIPGQTHPGENPRCLLCSQFGLGLRGGSLLLIKLSLLFEAGTAGLTDNHRDFDQLSSSDSGHSQLDYQNQACVFTRLGECLFVN